MLHPSALLAGEVGQLGTGSLGASDPSSSLAIQGVASGPFRAVCPLQPESIGGRSREEKGSICLPRQEHMDAPWGTPAPRTSLALAAQLVPGGPPSVTAPPVTPTMRPEVWTPAPCPVSRRSCHFSLDV